jgi:hypothetical protein
MTEMSKENISHLVNVYNELYTNNLDSKLFIDKYQHYSISINEMVCDKYFFDKKYRLISDYALHLSNNREYIKALPQLNLAINLYKKKYNLICVSNKDKKYDLLLYERMITYNNLKQNYKAYKEISNLCKKDPKNNNFIEWRRFIKLNILKRCIGFVWYLLLIISVVILAIKLNIISLTKYSSLILNIGYYLFGLIIIIEIVMKYRKREKN